MGSIATLFASDPSLYYGGLGAVSTLVAQRMVRVVRRLTSQIVKVELKLKSEDTTVKVSYDKDRRRRSKAQKPETKDPKRSGRRK